MKMTIEDVLSCPQEMSFEAWEKELKRIRKLKKKLCELSKERDFLEDALIVLEDEAGSDRWKRKKKQLEDVKAKINKICDQM